MATLLVKKGDTKRLPKAAKFLIGCGWNPANPGDEKVDLDVWVIRHHTNGEGEPICWANQDLHRPDLGANSEGNPYIATPELDVIHKGDDTTGATSATDYDETVALDLSTTPADVDYYDVFITYYEDPDSGSGVTLGMASGIVCGIVDETTGNTVKVELADTYGFDVTAHIGRIIKDPAGHWSLTSVEEGFPESMFVVMNSFGVS